MANWEDIKDKLGRAASKAVKKTEELADSASKHIKLKAIDSKLSGRYEMLGRLTYKQLKSGDSQAERISTVIEDIDLLRSQRRAIQAEIEADKQRRAEEKETANALCEADAEEEVTE